MVGNDIHHCIDDERSSDGWLSGKWFGHSPKFLWYTILTIYSNGFYNDYYVKQFEYEMIIFQAQYLEWQIHCLRLEDPCRRI